LQRKRDSGGSIIDHWKIEEIKNIKIPLLPNSIQEKIEKLCRESFLKRKQAEQLLNEAKLKVEKMIEKEVVKNNGV
jgi:restriction endonuclease S subunit